MRTACKDKRKAVKFIKPYSMWNTGEIAGFTKKELLRLPVDCWSFDLEAEVGLVLSKEELDKRLAAQALALEEWDKKERDTKKGINTVPSRHKPERKTKKETDKEKKSGGKK